MTKSRNNVIILQTIKNYTILKWGLGIGIENKHFFEKTDFFYKLNVIICLLLRQKHRVF